eukprot:CAMPEP_0181512500 /NCGR_PEP_ID=MMETSP1110-20121109/62003_1 /TAXON_ID=174948 /ORGANISM="Symbiodinium sp., Strain CCMP421" /LENGTH=83 /DNA_ID=CAMNT_0023642313 /DNA_START=189 /DNA_END=438 /DNA_ORIENTATION=+
MSTTNRDSSKLSSTLDSPSSGISCKAETAPALWLRCRAEGKPSVAEPCDREDGPEQGLQPPFELGLEQLLESSWWEPASPGTA